MVTQDAVLQALRAVRDPDAQQDIVSLGLKSIVSGTLATCLIGAIVGVLS